MSKQNEKNAQDAEHREPQPDPTNAIAEMGNRGDDPEPMPEFCVFHGDQVAPELPISRAWREALARKRQDDGR